MGPTTMETGRRAKVAEVLNISERNVYRLIKRYGFGEIAR